MKKTQMQVFIIVICVTNFIAMEINRICWDKCVPIVKEIITNKSWSPGNHRHWKDRCHVYLCLIMSYQHVWKQSKSKFVRFSCLLHIFLYVVFTQTLILCNFLFFPMQYTLRVPVVYLNTLKERILINFYRFQKASPASSVG